MNDTLGVHVMVARIDKHLGARIALAREQCGKSQIEIANEVDLSVARLTEYETGLARIPALYVARLARSLGVTPRWVFDGLPGQDAFDRTG